MDEKALVIISNSGVRWSVDISISVEEARAVVLLVAAVARRMEDEEGE